MTERIDLGDELAHFDEPSSDPRQKPEQPMHTPAPGGGAYMSLTDLQAAGFNTTPPPRFSAGGPNWRLLSASGGGGQPGGWLQTLANDANLNIDVKTWFGDNTIPRSIDITIGDGEDDD